MLGRRVRVRPVVYALLETYAHGGTFTPQARYVREADAFELDLSEDLIQALNTIRRPGEDLAAVIERLVTATENGGERATS